LLDFHSAPVPHPCQMRLRAHQYTHRAEFELGTHRGGLLHLIEAHVDDFELRMGDDQAIDAGVAASRDDGERFAWRPMAQSSPSGGRMLVASASVVGFGN